MIISPGVVIGLVERFALKRMKFIAIKRLVETAIVLSVCNNIVRFEKKVLKLHSLKKVLPAGN